MSGRRLCCLLALLLLAGCKSQSDTATGDAVVNETIVAATPPFKTREPDRYRATRVTTMQAADGESIVTKTLIARDGVRRRQETETETQRRAYLELPEGKFVLLIEEKLYADLGSDPETFSPDEAISAEWLLHAGSGTTSYQKVGVEAVGGRQAEKYRIVVNGAGAGSVNSSETLLWIDEALQMPIRSETTSTAGSKITTQLTDISLDVDNRAFQIPDDYQKVTMAELSKRLARP